MARMGKGLEISNKGQFEIGQMECEGTWTEGDGTDLTTEGKQQSYRAVIMETKKKLTGTKNAGNYVMLYSVVTQNTQSIVAMFIDRKWTQKLASHSFVHEIIKCQI